MAPLRVMPPLQRLSLDDNPLDPAGVAHIAFAIRSNTGLESVDLRGVHAGDEGARSLAIALRTNRTLRELHLQVSAARGRGKVPFRLPPLLRSAALVVTHTHTRARVRPRTTKSVSKALRIWPQPYRKMQLCKF